MVYGGETSKTFAGLGQGRRIRLVEEDLDLLRDAIPDVDRGSVSYGRWGTSFQMGKTRTNAFLEGVGDRKSTRLNSSHTVISYAVFCLKKKKKKHTKRRELNTYP